MPRRKHRNDKNHGKNGWVSGKLLVNSSSISTNLMPGMTWLRP